MADSKNGTLHGSAPDNAQLAVLVIDVINDLEFEEGQEFLKYALPAAKNIAQLKKRANEAKIPVIYVNDNFGRWRSDFKKIVAHCLEDPVRGQPIARLLAPSEEDYFVLKPKHSGFFSTTLDLLLEHLGVRTLIIVGFAGDNCVLFTANDAYMRDYKLIIPADCTASNKPEENENALRQMQKVLKADIRLAAQIDFADLLRAKEFNQPHEGKKANSD
jgi:nicotinamidase-related amidase